MSKETDKDLEEFAQGLASAIESFDKNQSRPSPVINLANGKRAPAPTKKTKERPIKPDDQTHTNDEAPISAGVTTTEPAVTQEKPAKPKPRKDYKKSPATNAVYLYRLSVRRHNFAPNEIFDYYSKKLSKLESEIDAKKAARDAGYPVFGHIYEIVHL